MYVVVSWPNVISQIGGFLTLHVLRPTKYDLLCVMLMAATADVLVVCTCVNVHTYVRTYIHIECFASSVTIA